MLFVALVLYRNRLLLLKRSHNPSKDTWELPAIEIAQTENALDVQQEFKSQIGLDIYPYLKVDSYHKRHENNTIALFKCSLLCDPAALSLSGVYSGYLWTYILKAAQLSFAPPHDDIINFLLHDPYAISRKTAGSGSSRGGFASMDPETRSMIAGLGGKAAHAMGKAHRFTSEEATRAGRNSRGKQRPNRTYDMSKGSVRSQLLTLLQTSFNQHPDMPVSFTVLGKEIGASRQYIRTLYHQLKKEYQVPPVGKRGIRRK